MFLSHIGDNLYVIHNHWPKRSVLLLVFPLMLLPFQFVNAEINDVRVVYDIHDDDVVNFVVVSIDVVIVWVLFVEDDFTMLKHEHLQNILQFVYGILCLC